MGIAPRLRKRTVVFDAAILAIAGVFVILTAPMIGGSIGDGIRHITASVTEQLGNPLGTAQIELPNGAANVVGAEPRVDGLPDFTREPELSISGRVPSFALAPVRTVEIVLNAAVVANAETMTPNVRGHPQASRWRERDRAHALCQGHGRALRYTVTLDASRDAPGPPPVDRAPSMGPTSSSRARRGGGSVDVMVGPLFRAGRLLQRIFTPAAGPVAITVSPAPRGERNDREVDVTLRAPTAAATLVTVTLDRARVRPARSWCADPRDRGGIAKPGRR